MLDFKAKNTGNRVVINEADFKTEIDLKNVILKEVQKYPVGVKLVSALRNRQSANDFIQNADIDLSSILDFLKNCLIGIDTNDDIMAVIWKCLSLCTYKTTYRIDDKLFDEVKEAREDYYEIVAKCLECNLRPFLKSLQSEFSILFQIVGDNPILNAALAENNK